MHAEASRRALIGAIVGLPVVAAVAAIPAPATATAPSNWRSAVHAMKKAQEARDAFEATVFDPAHAAWSAQIEAIPHLDAEFTDVAGFKYPMSTRDDWTVKTSRRELRPERKWHPDDHDYRDYCRKIVDHADWREAERLRIGRESGFNEIFEKSEDFDNAAYDALDAAILTPVANFAELHEKMELLAEHDGFSTPDWNQALLTDIRRLAGEA